MAVYGYVTITNVIIPPIQYYEGDPVPPRAVVINNYSSQLAVAMTCNMMPDNLNLAEPSSKWITPNNTANFDFLFNMPGHNITLTFHSWWWSGTQWVLDDTKTVSISLTVGAAWQNFRVLDYAKI